MIIGIPKEIKEHEYRVGALPSDVLELTKRGHKVHVQSMAGVGVGFSDDDYRQVGAEIESSAQKIYEVAEMIVKVKEPQPAEYDLVHEGQILFTYFHFASEEKLTKAMLEKKVIAIAYETIELEDKTLPCLMPMSQIAGRLSIQEGAKFLEKPMGGRGILLGGVPGVNPAKVMVLGGGTVGFHAAQIAKGMGADVTLLDINIKRLEYISTVLDVKTLYSNAYNIEEQVKEADLIIGAVLLPGAKAPKLIKKEHLKMMKAGSVLVDVAIDQGGCFETSKPTSHSNPVYIEDSIVHYCVTNMPGAVPFSSTYALTANTLSYAISIASLGWKEACRKNKALAKGLNIVDGKCVYEPVAKALGLTYSPIEL